MAFFQSIRTVQLVSTYLESKMTIEFATVEHLFTIEHGDRANISNPL